MIFIFLSLVWADPDFSFPIARMRSGVPSINLKAPFTGSDPYDFYNNSYIIVELKIGTPDQPLTLAVGTKHSIVAVPEESCDCLNAELKFNSTKSRTIRIPKNESTTINILDSNFTGISVYEVLTFDKPSVNIQDVFLVTETQNPLMAAGGYLGLGFPSEGVETVNFVVNLKRQLKIKKALFAIDRKVDIFYVGGYIEGRYVDFEMTNIPINTKNHQWEADLKSVRFGSTVIQKNTSVLFHIEDPFLRGSKNDVKVFINELMKKNPCNVTGAGIFCNCTQDNYQNFMEIAFSFEAGEIIIPPEKYLIFDNGTCQVMVAEGDTNNWIFGNIVLETYFGVFNFDERNVKLFKFENPIGPIYYMYAAIFLAFALLCGSVILYVNIRNKRLREQGYYYERVQ